MNGDEVRNVKFGRGLYDAAQVNDLLARIAAELDAGRPAGPLIANATFQQRMSAWRGYDSGAVDWLLDQLRRREDPTELARTNADPWRDLDAEPYCIHRGPDDPAGRIAAPSRQECADAWDDFGQQPGTRLSLVPTGARRRELRTAEQQTVAAIRGGLLPATLSAGGRTFTLKKVRQSSWPAVAETISRDRPDAPAHSLERQTDKKGPLLRQLLDEAGTPVLYTVGAHIDRSASACIKFPGHRWLRFPVRGRRGAGAIMTAVDQDGNKVARYRLAPAKHQWWTDVTNTVEIIVHPSQRLTEELALVIALSAPFLRSYFRSSGGGG